jgi:glutathione transport system substrate-binding protein
MLDNNRGTDMWIGRWAPGTGEADWGLRPNFYSDRVPPNYNNSGFYINPEVDKLLDQALAVTEKADRDKIYADVQKIIYQDAPWVFLNVSDNVIAKRSMVEGLVVRPDGSKDYNKAYVK